MGLKIAATISVDPATFLPDRGFDWFVRTMLRTLARIAARRAVRRLKADAETPEFAMRVAAEGVLIAAMEGMSWETPKGTMTFRPEDHQAMQDMFHFKIEVQEGVEWAVPTLGQRSRDPIEAAEGILRIGTTKMAHVVRWVTTERGLDAADFGITLGMNAAREGIARVAQLTATVLSGVDQAEGQGRRVQPHAAQLIDDLLHAS